MADQQPAQAPNMVTAAAAAAEKAAAQANAKGAAEQAAAAAAKTEVPITRMAFKDRIAAISSAVPNGTIPVRYRHEDVELPVEEVVRRAQIGMASEDLDKKRQEYEQRISADKARISQAEAWENFLKNNPTAAAKIQAIVEGREPARDAHTPARDERWDDEPLTPAPESGKIASLERQIQALSSLVNQTRSDFTTKSMLERLDEAASKHPFTRQHAEAAEQAREMAVAAYQRGEYQSPDEALPVMATRLQRVAESYLETQRKQREDQQREMASVPPGRGSPMRLPTEELDKIPANARGLRGAKDMIRQMIQGARRQTLSGP